MSAPCESDWKMLKSIARYLRSHPRVLPQYKYQDPPHSMEAIVDRLCWMQKNQKVHERWLCNARNAPHQELGYHTQTVIAMSSEEAEYYGVVKGACEAIGVVSLLQDLTGRRSKVRVNTDSSAARGIAMRRGVGKVRHLEVRTLWLQDQVDRGLVQIAKIAGENQPCRRVHQVP